MLYFAIRFLPHNCEVGVGELLSKYFDDYTAGVAGFTAGAAKSAAMHTGEIDITLITGGKEDAKGEVVDERLEFLWPKGAAGKDDGERPSQKHPIDSLIMELLSWFKALYAQDKKEESVPPGSDLVVNHPGVATQPRKLRAVVGAKRQSASISAGRKPRQLTDAEKAELHELAQRLWTHDAMEELLGQYMMDRGWPSDDKGADKKPIKGYSPPKENIPITSSRVESTKRPLDGREEPTSKRLRSNA